MRPAPTRNPHGRADPATWLERTWGQAHHLRHRGVPVIGYTWYSLTDQVDWNIGITRIEGTVNANGLCRLDRTFRPVGDLYKTLAHQNAGASLIYGVPDGLLMA